MVSLIVFMGVILFVAIGVATYVAFPHRGEELPAAPWLGDAMRKGVDALPVLDERESVN